MKQTLKKYLIVILNPSVNYVIILSPNKSLALTNYQLLLPLFKELCKVKNATLLRQSLGES